MRKMKVNPKNCILNYPNTKIGREVYKKRDLKHKNKTKIEIEKGEPPNINPRLFVSKFDVLKSLLHIQDESMNEICDKFIEHCTKKGLSQHDSSHINLEGDNLLVLIFSKQIIKVWELQTTITNLQPVKDEVQSETKQTIEKSDGVLKERIYPVKENISHSVSSISEKIAKYQLLRLNIKPETDRKLEQHK